MNKKFDIGKLELLSNKCKGDILTMTTLAASGHPGGSISSLDVYLALYEFANVSAENRIAPARDRIVISHGHTSPGIYSVLGRNGFFDLEEAIAYFRKAGSIFEGHVEPDVPGIEWATGNLGQGLSAGIGFALAAKQKEEKFDVYVVMGDGEQQKGQIAEARRFASKYELNKITGIVDYNRLQISGDISEVMPQQIKENYQSDGWKVLEINGHDFDEIFSALKKSQADSKNPYLILANTIMGKGVSFMENDETYHGKPLSEEQYKQAMRELSLNSKLTYYRKMRKEFSPAKNQKSVQPQSPNAKTKPEMVHGSALYKRGKVAPRNAYGAALLDLAEANEQIPFAVFDCDLAGSVRTNDFAEKFPHAFYQSGIQEHNTAVIAGAISKENIITFFSDFGVFGVDETYNQQRLNDINHTNLKLVTTHVGLDVGEDGKTHQCIDYIGLMRNLYGFKIIIPADANQTDKVIRYIASHSGNYFVALGRSKIEIITTETGDIFYDQDQPFQYGKADKLRKGKDGALLATGVMVEKALKIHKILRESGIEIAVWNFSSLSAISKEDMKKVTESGKIFTYEDHNVHTGLGSIIASKLLEFNLNATLVKFGVSQYGISGKSEDVYQYLGLDPETVAIGIRDSI